MYYKSALTALFVAASAAWLSGCTTANAVPSSTSQASVDDSELRQRNARISALESELRQSKGRVSSLEQRLTSTDRSSRAPVSSSAGDSLFPPNAKAGECYARILIPERYETSSDRVLAKEASARVEIIPARYETGTERVLVKEASSRLEVIPATYETVTERVLVKAESSRIVEVPATYRTETERVLDTPASTVWKKGKPGQFGNAVVSQSVNGTGEVMCLVDVPAKYKTITKTVVDKPASTKEIKIPAEYKTVTRKAVSRPASTREVTIPAEYQTLEVRNVAKPATERRIEIPAEYRTVTKTVKVADAQMSWQTVLCDVNATPSNIRSLQAALDKAGYNPGGVDGTLGAGTLSAVNRYAKANGIPTGDNYVPMDVLKKLRVTL